MLNPCSYIMQFRHCAKIVGWKAFINTMPNTKWFKRKTLNSYKTNQVCNLCPRYHSLHRLGVQSFCGYGDCYQKIYKNLLSAHSYFCFIHFFVVSHQCKLELKPLEPVYRDVCVVIPQLECSMSVEYDQFSTVRDVLHQVLSLTDPPLDPTEGYSLYHVRLRMK